MTEQEKKAIILDLLSKIKVLIDTMMTKTQNAQEIAVDQFYLEMYWAQVKMLKSTAAQ